MSKELEALNSLGHRLASVDTSKTIEEAYYDVFPIIRKALTPPTSEDVCKALSEYLDQEVNYNQDEKIFVTKRFCEQGIGKWGFDVEYITEYNSEDYTYTISYYLASHLITLIGRFYEAQENGI